MFLWEEDLVRDIFQLLLSVVIMLGEDVWVWLGDPSSVIFAYARGLWRLRRLLWGFRMTR